MILEGQIAVVTGGSRGIGRAVSIRLAKEGAKVIINYITNEDSATETLREIEARGGKAEILRFDVSSFEKVQQVFRGVLDEHKRIDILVNNAGITRDNLFVRMKEVEWSRVLEINLSGSFNCCRAAAKSMMRRKTGKIVNISSIAGEMGNPGQANYSASKAGLIGLTKSLSRELANWGIRVNAIAPGYIETEMTEGLTEKVKEEVLKAIPLARFGKPDDVAEAVLFLVSNRSDYITGHTLNLSGGLYI